MLCTLSALLVYVTFYEYLSYLVIFDQYLPSMVLFRAIYVPILSNLALTLTETLLTRQADLDTFGSVITLEILVMLKWFLTLTLRMISNTHGSF
jgi:hypothetical protein